MSTLELIETLGQNQISKASNLHDHDKMDQFSQSLLYRAEQGDSQAQFYLAFQTDESDAIEHWLEKASDSNHHLAQYYYGLYLTTHGLREVYKDKTGLVHETPYYINVEHLDQFLGIDKGVSPDGNSDQAFDFKKWLKKERNRLRIEKQKQTDESCHSKKLDKIEKGISMLQRSLESGHEPSGWTLGHLYFNPSFEAFNVRLGIDTLMKMKSGYAYFKIGEYYHIRWMNGEDSDPSQSIHYFRLSADAGDPNAQNALASMYFQGLYHDIQEDTAYAYLAEATANGQKDAMAFMATLYHQESLNHPELIPQAIEMYQKASEDPANIQALMALGHIYYHGELEQEVDMPKSFRYYQKASKQSDPDALMNVGAMYFLGLGVDMDLEKAFYSYQNAAVLNHIPAMHNLADMYERGLGIPKSDMHAQYYRDLAAGKSTASTLEEMLSESSKSSN